MKFRWISNIEVFLFRGIYIVMCFFLAIATIMLCGVPPSTAKEATGWLHTFYFENDLFNGTDSNYTNGVKYSLISPDLSPHATRGKLPRRVLALVHKIPFIAQSTPDYSHQVEFSIGQNMYTPGDISQLELIENDRPYAGWTYLSTAYHRKCKADNRLSFMDTVELQIGIVGPESFAEESQKLIHEIRNLTRPNGWDNQLDNELGLAIVFERKWLFYPIRTHKLGYSAISHVGVALGNVYTYFNTGMEFRLGWNIPEDFGVSLIRPAGSTRLKIEEKFSFYLFGAVNAKAVARDIFLDGNTFADSHSIDKKNSVADFAGGAALSYHRLMLTWTQVMRTKEFRGQKDLHSFGSIAFSFSVPF